MPFSIIIPAYLEEKRIAGSLRSIVSALESGGAKDWEIIVVIDGNDATEEIVKKLGDARIKTIKNLKHAGKGRSISIGMEAASNELVGYVDADEAIPASEIVGMLRHLENSPELAGVIASRRHKQSRITKPLPPLRIMLSAAFNLLVRLMLGLPYSDTQCGAKFFRKEAIRGILPLRTNEFCTDVEILYRLKGVVEEYPVTWSHTEGSRFSLKYVPGMFAELVSIRLGTK